MERPLKVMHLGSYGTNLGDAVALYNLRTLIDKHIKVKWKRWNIKEYIVVKDINKCDALLIGGGGLISGGHKCGQEPGVNHWHLPFSARHLPKIKVPIFVCGVGLNFWRNQPNLSSKGIENLQALVEQASYFSVRNDGSYEEIMKITPHSKIKESVDPGFYTEIVSPRKSKMQNGVFNISGNAGYMMRIRKISYPEIQKIMKRYRFPIIRHAVSDIVERVHGEYIPVTGDFEDVKQLDKYHEYDFALVMRGHGQIICFAKNIPFISINTQDKMSGLSLKSGLIDYCVDTFEQDWRSKLYDLIDRLMDDPEFVHQWYEKRDKYNIKVQEMLKTTVEDFLDFQRRITRA